MLPNLASAVTGLNADQAEMSVVANNLANQTTPGFKSGEGEFSQMLAASSTIGQPPATALGNGGRNPSSIGYGTMFGQIVTNEAQGTIAQTGNPLDFAVQGNGYFEMTDSQGAFLSRAGQFSLDQNGSLVDAQTGMIIQGYTNVSSAAGTTPATLTGTTKATLSTTLQGIQLPQTLIYTANATTPTTTTAEYQLSAWSVGQDGTIDATYNAIAPQGAITTPAVSAAQAQAAAQATPTIAVVLGQVVLGTVSNPAGLVQTGNNLLQVGVNSGAVVSQVPETGGSGAIIQGALENSNTNVAQEMANLVTYSGAYDANARVITMAQAMAQALAQMVQ